MKSIKGLMILCQVMLLIFTLQWLESQYNEEQALLKKDLTKLFTDVQHRVSDSILLTNVIDPCLTGPGCNKYAGDEEERTPYTQQVRLSAQGMHRVLAGTSISKTEENRLFRMDTIAFNEMFAGHMRNNGWNFHSSWINNADTQRLAQNEIFIKSDFFTTENGVVVSDYKAYLLRRLVPEAFFIIILLTLTATAFIVTFKSLKAQIKLSSLKDDFISNMSHELKTPIATVKVTLEALSNYNVIDNPKLSREYLGMAITEMDRLELLATRVLNTSLLENGNIDMQREACDLRQLVAGLLQTMQVRLAQHGATASFTFTGNNFCIPADKLHIQGVLVNLIDNSLKYGEAPVHINIDLKEEAGKLQLSLTDNGPGIPEEYRERVFDKFFRVPAGDRHNTKGHGLGLNYAKQIMRLHNGTINVANMAEGGCTFTLSF
ncbi:MAG: HAMP domain-containing sensor histidine kinase [Bacteroidota bacterium]